MKISDTAVVNWGTLWRSSAKSVSNLWHSRVKAKSLVVRETAALGDRRFVAVVQFERKRFLIGATSASITLLSALPDNDLTGDTD